MDSPKACMQNKALASALKYFRRCDGNLIIGARTCSEIAAEVGTPFYAYDLNVARKKYEMLRAALPDDVEIHYAVKANPHQRLLEFFRQIGAGFDVASVGELHLALRSGVDPFHIGFAGPGKRRYEIREACRAGIGSLNAESVLEIEIADRIAAEEHGKLRISLRVNPGYELSGAGMKMGGGPKPFGIDQEHIPEAMKVLHNCRNLDFVGFHIFAGSQNLRSDSIVQAFEGSLDAVLSFLPYCPRPPQLLNLGGGFGIPYYSGDEELDIEAVGRGLNRSLSERRKHLHGVRLCVESGRYLVGECGVYICRVLYRKESRGEIFLVVDGGMHHNLAASGNFGQVIKRNFPICAPEKLDEPSREVVNIVGPLCTPLDRLGSKADLPRLCEGDIIGILCSGSYGFTASPLSFLGHASPQEIVLD